MGTKKNYRIMGIDVGNSDTKSQNSSTPNGYSSHAVKPAMADEWLFYDGTYYCPSENRFNYMEDKTTSERALILSLFGIAKQTLWMAKKAGKESKEEIQTYVSSKNNFIMGIGLPLTHMKKAASNVSYFNEHMGNGIEFEYCGYKFSMRLIFCKCFPQGFAAVCTNGKDDIINQYPKFVAVDIGGGTMDVLPYSNNSPDPEKCITDKVGISFMYKSISQSVKKDFGIELEDEDIYGIIKNQPSFIEEEVKEEVERLVQKWVDEKIVDKLEQSGINLSTTCLIFFGGGSLLLKSYIYNNKIVKHIHFLASGVHANAKGFGKMVEEIYAEVENS